MFNKILAILMCMMFLTLIPIGISTQKEVEKEDLLGWAWVRGFVLNPKVQGNTLTCRALRLHVIEFTPQGTSIGIYRLRSVSMNDNRLLRHRDMGILGTLSFLYGFTHGGVESP